MIYDYRWIDTLMRHLGLGRYSCRARLRHIEEQIDWVAMELLDQRKKSPSIHIAINNPAPETPSAAIRRIIGRGR